jgi:hypothetical protein
MFIMWSTYALQQMEKLLKCIQANYSVVIQGNCHFS